MSKIIKKIIASSLLAATLLIGIGALSSCNVDWDYCQHKLEEIPKSEASCMKVGKKTAYQCVKCGKLFAYGYLNGKDGTKGIYEISNQEMLDYSNHKIGDLYGDLKADMTTFDASSLEDFSVWSHCSEEGCGEAFEVELQNLIPFAPCDNTSGNADYVVVGEETDATRFEIPANTQSGKCITIYTGGSKMNTATNKIPFSANTDRHVILFFHNDGNQDVNVRYGTEFYGERVGVDVTVPANGYATAYLNINMTQSNSDCYHELYINSDIKEGFGLTISGFYYNEAKLQSVKIEEYPKVEYAIGEVFSTEGLEVVAKFGDIERKLDADDYTLVLNNNKPITEPLTEEDDKVYVIYKNKQTSFTIKVQRYEQTVNLVAATFADGTASAVLDRNSIIPADIVATNGKTIEYFIDQYGAKYVPGEGRVPAYNATLSPVYSGVSFSDNYALGADVSVSSTSHGGSKGSLVDGVNSVNSDADGRWSSKSNYETATPDEENREWVMVDLGGSKSICQVVLYPRVYGGYFPETYEILVSEDGEKWQSVVSVECDELASKGSALGRWNGFESVNARYVKVVAIKMTDDGGGAGYIFQLSEIEIYGETSGN